MNNCPIFKARLSQIMSAIVTAVFKATIGLLVNKGRDKAAEKLKDGDVTERKISEMIERDISQIKAKLDGLSRKDLKSSISFFKEGIELLYQVFDKTRSRSEYGAVTTQAACDEAFSLVEGMGNLELTGLDESSTRKLSSAKERFKDARRKATEAFANEALEISDRILAMQYRVMATILETVDNPADAVAPCKVCIEELHSLPAVQNSFDVQLKKGIQAVRGLFSKEARREIISSVCHVNRVMCDVTLTVGKCVSVSISPVIDTGKEKVEVLNDERVTKVLRKQGMEHCCVPPCVPWSFGQEGEKEHKLKHPTRIATNSSGQFIVGDSRDRNVKVFDSRGKFVKHFSLPTDDVNTWLCIEDIATDMNDNIYVLAVLGEPRTESYWVVKFSKTADTHHKFPLRGGWYKALSVNDGGKVLLLRYWKHWKQVRDLRKLIGREVCKYETDGQFVRSFGEGILKDAGDITVANDGRVMVVDRDDSCVDIFSEDGDHHNKFKLERSNSQPRIAFHRASEHVVVADVKERTELLHVGIYTKDGEFVHSTQIHEEGMRAVTGITVTTEGRIAVVAYYYNRNSKVLVL